MQTATAVPVLHMGPPWLALEGGHQLDCDIAVKALDAGKRLHAVTCNPERVEFSLLQAQSVHVPFLVSMPELQTQEVVAARTDKQGCRCSCS